jgi:hypothetical protein
MALSLLQDVGGFKVGVVVAETLLHSKMARTIMKDAILDMAE